MTEQIVPMLMEVDSDRLGLIVQVFAWILFPSMLVYAAVTLVHFRRDRTSYPPGEAVALRASFTIAIALSLIPAALWRDGGYFMVIGFAGAALVAIAERFKRPDDTRPRP